MARERWGSKLGVILAVAGSAVGLGNFLRFPAKCVANGGGAFMVPYFVALLLLGLPLMWVEWTIGRFGGGFGHSTAPGMFQNMWNKNRFIKYFGVIGIFGPIAIYIYYVYIESWLLGYAWFSANGRLLEVAHNAAATSQPAQEYANFLSSYLGQSDQYFDTTPVAYIFFLVTFLANLLVVRVGLRRGIETVCKWGLGLLFVLAVALMVRVLTMPAHTGDGETRTAIEGLGQMWNADWSVLGAVQGVHLFGLRFDCWVPNANVWFEAAAQIFFTLSVGMGVILTYASYLKKRDDVVLSGLTAAATNEAAEVVLGGSIVIPAAFAFLGIAGTLAAAKGGVFNLGFITMPMVLNQMPWSQAMSVCWFGLLFLAGITSSISLAQPAIAFLEDEFNLTKRQAVAIFSLVTFLLCQLVIFGWHRGVLDELDTWGTSFALVLFATIEVILFSWVFGMERAWTELHVGADLRIPRVYRFIIKYVTPAFLLAMLAFWLWQEGIPSLLLTHLKPEQIPDLPWIIGTRYLMLGMLFVLVLLVNMSWRRRREAELLAGGPFTREDKP